MSLSDTAARTAKSRGKSYKLYDQKGLYLQVNPPINDVSFDPQ
jgi:hypothetical protein